MSPSASPTELNLMLSLMLLLSPNAYSDSKDISSTTDNIATPGTPQQLVFEWLCPDETCGFPEDEAERIEARLSDAGRVMELQQLYALATFYLSTGASEWLQRDGWEDDLSTLVDDSATMDPSITSSPLTTLVFRSKGDTPAGGAAWCSWHGVECWQIPPSADLPVAVSYVSGLVLSQNDMHGVQIPSELAFLSTIQTFNISQNSLAGTLPSSLGENYAAHLEFFDVSYNILTGMVPSSYGVWEKVKLLDASHNLMSDKPPANVCELKVQLDTTIAMDCNKNDAGKVRVCCGCCRICCVGGRAETTDDGINFVENQCIEQSTGPLPNDCVLVDDG
uniref:Leucine-rich repeat-containing N-terminal plant-type domain-containing protein n=1 Tax=Craspedostauros australis TaxID=1486917 RepID=A0A6T6EP39_9STRA